MVKIPEQVHIDVSNAGTTKECVIRTINHIKSFQMCVRKHIEDKYASIILNNNFTDIYMEEGKSLLRDTEDLLCRVSSDCMLALSEARIELSQCVDELHEISLGLKISWRLLKVEDLFQRVEEANAKKDYLTALDVLGKVKSLICSETNSDIDHLFQKVNCYDSLKVKYHIQANILQQNLQQKFERLVQFSEKNIPSAKSITLQVSKDYNQLQNTIRALFQAKYNPTDLCDFLLNNCLIPMITKPVSVQKCSDNPNYVELSVSFSLRCLNKSLRPSYKQVLNNIKMLFEYLRYINVNISTNQHVLGIIGHRIKDRFLIILVQECLMNAIPETMDEYQESTLVEDICHFEQILAHSFFIDLDEDKHLKDFVSKYEILFCKRFTSKVLDQARDIMLMDLQDMTMVSEGNTALEVERNSSLFPQCMVSKSTLELIKLMEKIIVQPLKGANYKEENRFLSIIPSIINAYCSEVPKLHEKLILSIPQQAILFYNNCMLLAHWITGNSEMGIPTFATLTKLLKENANSTLKCQELFQKKLISQILKEIDISDTHSIGSMPIKLIRQCLRQLELLKNVWLNVLPESVYKITFCSIITEFCQEIICRILLLEDISATVANELSELIDDISNKAPELFKEKYDILIVPCWMKLQQLKVILNASLQDIVEQWCGGAGILTVNFSPDEVRHLIRALFQNTDRRAKALSKII